ncbi:protealysin inhibitor emfourin [Spirosoma agri]|uniref:Uncharacterized protein n=1 Tax=Spirosoma agri TaxID=1987381 RepID=A0A6M0IGI4_9BACT|nr:protealysin inhibitor emfourin [Spirosoma agri]NEU66922.1 hypothetical protein [Spirosoma agri]
MKLTYSREGGLFPQLAQTEMHDTDLPANLQKLAGAVLANPETYKAGSANKKLRDGYQYTLNLQEGRRTISLTFDDGSLPEDVQPLIQFLQQRTGKP